MAEAIQADLRGEWQRQMDAGNFSAAESAARAAARSAAPGDDDARRRLAMTYERWAKASYERLDFEGALEKLYLCLKDPKLFTEWNALRMRLLVAHLHRRLDRKQDCLRELERAEQEYSDREAPYVKNLFLNEREITAGKTVLESYPSRMTVRLTNTCNMRCVMCVMPTETPWYVPTAHHEEIRFLTPYLEDLQWQGGEPFVMPRPFFRGLLERGAQNRYLGQSIITNGVLIDKEWAEVLVRCRVFTRISVDGPNKQVYEKIRKGGKWDDLVRAVENIQEEMHRQGKTTRLELHMVVMRSNYRHIADTIDFAKKYGFSIVDLSHVMGDHFKEENIFTYADKDVWRELQAQRSLARRKALEAGIQFGDALPYPPREFVSEEAVEAKPQSGQAGPEGIFSARPAADSVPSATAKEAGALQASAAAPPRRSRGSFYCLSAWKKIIVRDSGPLITNWHCDRDIGHTSRDSLLKAWNSPQMQEYRKRISDNTQDGLCTSYCLSGALIDSWRDQIEWNWS
jgi:uncharacterized Fe-S cluster-containing radical SAM superfamily protein